MKVNNHKRDKKYTIEDAIEFEELANEMLESIIDNTFWSDERLAIKIEDFVDEEIFEGIDVKYVITPLGDQILDNMIRRLYIIAEHYWPIDSAFIEIKPGNIKEL